MQQLLKTSDKLNKIILRFPKLMLFCNVGFWFLVGMLLSYSFEVIPLLRQIEFFHNHISMASLFGMVVGYIGGLFVLIRIPEQDDNENTNRKGNVF